MTATVNRWHANACPKLRNSGDTIDMHQLRVVELCRDLAARIGHSLHDSDLLFAARHHDEPERVLGDMPAPAKERFPALAAAYAKAELQVLTEMGLRWNLTRRENDMLHLCDRLDARNWATAHGATGPEWDAARLKLVKLAHAIGPDAVAWVQEQLCH